VRRSTRPRAAVAISTSPAESMKASALAPARAASAATEARPPPPQTNLDRRMPIGPPERSGSELGQRLAHDRRRSDDANQGKGHALGGTPDRQRTRPGIGEGHDRLQRRRHLPRDREIEDQGIRPPPRSAASLSEVARPPPYLPPHCDRLPARPNAHWRAASGRRRSASTGTGGAGQQRQARSHRQLRGRRSAATAPVRGSRDLPRSPAAAARRDAALRHGG
jgi:hypothetical protein